MPINVNPLKQYFRRPSVYLKLPSGTNMYPPEVVKYTQTGELPVYPMTAIDEITQRTPDALFNGSAIVDLIHSCVPNIVDPWKLASIDIDAILIAIRAAADGDSYDLESICPKCENNGKFGINLIKLLSTLTPGNYAKELVIGDLSFKFRPITYKEMNEANMAQFEVQQYFASIENETDANIRTQKTSEAVKKVTELTMKILASGIVEVKTPEASVTEYEYILEFLKECEKKTYVQLRDYNASLKSSTEVKPLTITCANPECKHEYTQPFTLNMSDFFG